MSGLTLQLAVNLYVATLFYEPLKKKSCYKYNCKKPFVSRYLMPKMLTVRRHFNI